MEWETEGTVPEHVFAEFGAGNMLIPNLPAPLPVDWLKRLGINELPGGLKVEEFDYIHQSIYVSEVSHEALRDTVLQFGIWLTHALPPYRWFEVVSQDLQDL